MGELHETAALVGFYGDDLDPREISEALGCEPTVGVKKGGVWRTSRGGEKIAHTGSWRLKVERGSPGDLDGQINQLFDRLSDDAVTWRSFAARFRGVVFCGLFLNTDNEGISLRPQTLFRIGERGLELDLDIYGAAGE